MATRRSPTHRHRHTSSHSRRKQAVQSSSKVILFPRLRQKLTRRGKKRINLERRANIGAITFGALGIFLADLVGVGELALGGLAAYAAYRVIRYNVSPSEALLEGAELERGEVPRHMSRSA
jgi:hypothetical protein